MRVSVIVAVIGVLSCEAGARAEQEFDGAAAYEYVRTQVAFGPRVPNTEGHRQAGDWILSRLRLTADVIEEHPFTHVTREGDTLELRNFLGRFNPDAQQRILYVAHWDTRPIADYAPDAAARERPILGANDGASGVAVLLGVAAALARTPPEVGVDLLFVDGEDYGDWALREDVLIGSTYYAENLSSEVERPLFAVVWDMVGDADLRIPQEGNSHDFAPEVVRRVWSTAERLGYEKHFIGRVGRQITDDHIPLQEAGIRAIDVIDLDYGPNNRYWHTQEDTIDKVSAESLQIVGDVAMAVIRR